jgi:hypothetical protein
MPSVKPTLALAVLLASPILGACVEPGVCDGVHLLQAQTADEEADEMHRFRAECRPLSMRVFGADGRPVPIDDDWMSQVHHIELSGRGSRLFEHTILDTKNLAHLTGE